MDGRRGAIDWALFVGLTLLWASAYAFTKIAVDSFPPRLIIPMRLTIGAGVLLIALVASGRRLPSLGAWRNWRAMAAMGVVGMALPFFVITTAQQTVDSSLAALYVAATPIFVVAGAHFLFAEERLTPTRGLGVLIGFLGVAALFGPAAFASIGAASPAAQALCLLGTACYATSTLIARAAPPMHPLVFAAGFVTVGAILSWPMAIGVDFGALNPSVGSILAVVGLGLGPSALASLCYMTLVARAGPTFLSLTGYAIPIVSVVIGYLAFGETQSWNVALAFGLILGGVWLAQRRRVARSQAKAAPEETSGAVS